MSFNYRLRRLKRSWEEWLDPFLRYKRREEEARRQRKNLVFGVMYGVTSTPSQRAWAARFINESRWPHED